MTVAAPITRTPLRTARELLDEALTNLRAIEDPNAPVAATERCLVEAMTAIYRAMEHANDAERARHEGAQALQFAREALAWLQHRESPDEVARALSGLVAQSLDALIRAGHTTFIGSLGIPRREDLPLRPAASVDVPRRVAVSRDVIPPTVVLPRPESPPAPGAVEIVQAPGPAADPAAIPALRALGEARLAALDVDDLPPSPRAAPPAPARPTSTLDLAHFGEATPIPALLLAHAGALFDELSMMGLMRRPDPGDLWHELQPVERRLLARLDALVAIGPQVFPKLIKRIEERPVADPEAFWGGIFLHGCLDGDDALDACLRLARSADLDDEEMFDAVTDALAVAPHVGVDAALAAWLRAHDGALRRVAVAVLGRRRALPAPALCAMLADPDERVVREAAGALPTAEGAIPDEVLHGLLHHGDPALAHAGMTAAGLRGILRGTLRAHDLVRGGAADHGCAALHLAAGCTAEMLPALGVAMAHTPSSLVSEALGIAGVAEAVPWLLDRADAGDDAALIAVQRITGASLEEGAEPPEVSDDAPPFTERFARCPNEIVLCADVQAWRDWWARWGPRAAPSIRWRHGRPWTLEAVWRELAEHAATPWERTWAWTELCVRTGRPLPFDPRDWVAPQRRQVEAWRDYIALRRKDFVDGQWQRGGRA